MTGRKGDIVANPDRENRFSAYDLLQAHPIATILIDSQNRVAEANQATESLLNRARNSLLNQPVADALFLRDKRAIERLLKDDGQYGWAYSVDIERETGLPITVDLALGPMTSKTGFRALAIHPVPRSGRVPFRRPGTGARSAEAAAALLAHEIKNPLSGIRGAAQLMGKSGGAQSQSLSRLICGEVDRIAGLIDGMQGFSRGIPITCSSINIYPAIAQARGIAMQGFAKTARVIEEFDPSLPRVLGNHDALVQILINLMKNACEAHDGKSPLIIRINTAFRYGLSWDNGDGRGPQPLPVEIQVQDNGPGVPEHLVDAIFDPFVSGKRDGQGLGLALVDKLTRDMGGMVQYERASGWTRFRLHLPVAKMDRADISPDMTSE